MRFLPPSEQNGVIEINDQENMIKFMMIRIKPASLPRDNWRLVRDRPHGNSRTWSEIFIYMRDDQ